jgi:hypothetical protein
MQRVVVSLLAAASLFLACSGGTTKSDYAQTQTPVTPKGSITARIIDGSNYQPLADVAVTVVGSTATLTTDANGVATFSDAVVSSTYTFVFEKTGYLRQTTTSSIQGTTGNSPLAGAITTFTLTLYKADATVKGSVFLPNGTPAKGATVYIDEKGSNPVAGDAVATTQTAADGSFTLTGIASRPQGFSFTVYALYYDENGDGQADYPTTTTSVSSLPGQSARVFLTYTSLSQRVVASSVVDGALAPGTDLSFTFALPVQASNYNGNAASAFTLRNLTRGTVEAVTVTWASDVVANVKPVVALAVGERYEIDLALTNANASSSNSSPAFAQSYFFQVRPEGATPITTPAGNLSLQNGSPSNNTPAGLTQYDYNTNYFKLQWDAVAGAVSYSVYAKDTKLNPDWVLVASVTPSSASRLVWNGPLPAAFDMIPSTGGIEPLAGGNAVTFTVVPVDVYGYNSPLATAPTAIAADNIQPTWTSSLYSVTTSPIFGTVDAINDETGPAQWIFRISSSEPMDAVTPPVFTGSGATTQAWVWDAFNNAFTLTLTIQPGVDASGPFLVRGGKDSSGNPIVNGDIQGGLNGYKELLTHGAFEDASGACTITGWTPTNTGGMLAPSAILGTGVATSRCSAVLGAPNGSAAATGVSRIDQSVTLPTIPALSGWNFRVHLSARGVTQLVGTPGYQSCRIATNDGNDTLIQDLVRSVATTAASFGPTQYGTVATPIIVNPGANASVKVICEVNNTAAATASNTSLYVDDFNFVLAKTNTGWL